MTNPAPHSDTDANSTPPTLVSACLLGAACRYDGQSKPVSLAIAGAIIPVCPEVMAGFGVPRPAIERGIDGRVRVIETGVDITVELVAASDRIVDIAKRHGARRAILKERSPSCGSSQLRRGPDIVQGEGLLTERLRASGIIVESELQ